MPSKGIKVNKRSPKPYWTRKTDKENGTSIFLPSTLLERCRWITTRPGPGNPHFEGLTDELVISNRDLTAVELQDRDQKVRPGLSALPYLQCTCPRTVNVRRHMAILTTVRCRNMRTSLAFYTGV